MAARIKMPLRVEVGLRPGDFVLDADLAPLPKKGAEPPNFRPCLLWPNRWMDQDGSWYGGRPQPSDFMLDWDRAPSPIFGPFLLWPNG